MPILDAHSLMTLAILTMGCGLFLRIVAREKVRREKYLALRLDDRIKELEKRGELEERADESEEMEEVEPEHTAQAA